MDTLDDPMWVVDSRTVEDRSQQVSKIVAPEIRWRTGFAHEELASSIAASRVPGWPTVAFAS